MATRTNLYRNPSFETGTTYWSTEAAVGDTAFSAMSRVVQTSTIGARWGQYSLRGTTASATTHSWSNASGSSNWTAVTAGKTYTFSVYGRSSVASRTMGALIWWYDSSAIYISGTLWSGTSLSNSSWSRTSVTATAPTGAAYARFSVRYSGAAASGEFFYMDGLLFEEASSMGSYFDGASWDAAGGQQVTSWTSTAHASTSTSTDYPRVNLSRNPSFETSTTGVNTWVTQPSHSRSTTMSGYAGAYALAVTHTSSNPGLWFGTTADVIPNPGGTYTFSAYARVSSGSVTCTPGLGMSSDGVSTNIAFSSPSFTVGTDWTRVSYTYTFPIDGYTSGTTYFPNYFSYFISHSPASSQVVYWDAIQIEQTSSAGSYIDGESWNTSNDGQAVVKWTGTAHASQSHINVVADVINLVQNPSLETNITGYTAYSFTTLSRVTEVTPYSGTYVLKSVTTSSGGCFTSDRRLPGKGVTYVLSAYCRAASGTAEVQLKLSIGSSSSGYGVQVATATVGTSWTRLTTSYTTNFNTVTPLNDWRLELMQTAASTVYWDAIQLEQASTASNYIGDGTYSVVWVGTAHASTSYGFIIPTGSTSGTYDFSGVAVGEFPLAAPASLVATAQPSGTQINLTWGAVNGALWYDIERDDVIVARWITTNSYNDTGLTPNTSYTYRVRAVRNHAT